MQDESVILFVKTTNQQLIDKLAQTGLNIILFERFTELKKKIREIVFPGQALKNKDEDSGKKSKKVAAAAASADNKDESLADGLF